MTTALVKKNRGGRPSKYNKGTIRKVKAYIKKFENDGGTDKFHILPSLVGLANYLKITKETMNQWEKTRDENGDLLKPEFTDAVNHVRKLCEITLANKGLTGEFKTPMAIFLLKNYAGMADKTEINSHIIQDIRIASITADVAPDIASQAYKDLIK